MIKRSISFSGYGAIERPNRTDYRGVSSVGIYRGLAQDESSSSTSINDEINNLEDDSSAESRNYPKYGCVLFALGGLATFLWAYCGLPPYPSPSHAYGMIAGCAACGTGTVSSTICHCVDQHKKKNDDQEEHHHSPRV